MGKTEEHWGRTTRRNTREGRGRTQRNTLEDTMEHQEGHNGTQWYLGRGQAEANPLPRELVGGPGTLVVIGGSDWGNW